jgi:hypothetical protein
MFAGTADGPEVKLGREYHPSPHLGMLQLAEVHRAQKRS